MKKRFILLLVLALSLALAASAFAVGETGVTDTGKTGAAATDQMKGLKGEDIRASQVLDKEVETPSGEKIGKITDVIIDQKTGRTAFGIVEGDSSFVGSSGKLFAVPWKAFTPSSTGDKLVLNVDKTKMTSAPSFTKDSWPNLADRKYMSEVYKYYGISPAFEEGGKAPSKKEMKEEKKGKSSY